MYKSDQNDVASQSVTRIMPMGMPMEGDAVFSAPLAEQHSDKSDRTASENSGQRCTGCCKNCRNIKF